MARPGPEGLLEAAPAARPAVFFSTDIPNNLLQLDNVIVNEFHVLRRFHLISLCDEPLQITLDSNLGFQLGFQLNNENLASTDESSGESNNFASFLADDFNELFNTVNLVHEVILQPRQVQQVIITFRPSDMWKEAVRLGNLKDEADMAQQSSHQEKLNFDPLMELSKDALPDINRTFEVNGKLFLSATGLSNDNTAARGGYRQDIVVRFLSRVCKSLLRADVADIVFNDCAPGGVFVKDFSIWNLCDIPCSYQLHVKNIKPELPNLDLTDYDTGIPVTGGEINSCAHKRIRVTFKPRDLGDYGFTIQLDNNYDERNSICIPVHCSVNAEHRQEGLLVTGVGEDGMLDFGDCYAENGTCQMLTLRNITQEALVISLGTDHAPGDQVAFYLQADVDISATSAKFHPEDSSYVEDALGKSLDCILTLDKKNRIEETLLERGEEKNILVWLYPIGAIDETKAVKLQRRNFRISLKCAEKKGSSSHGKQGFAKIIQCKARVCTSIIRLSPSEMNLGDCNVGSSKAATVEIENLSDLPALITAHVTSTILSFKSKAERISLLPCEVYSLNMEIVPLKINLKYRKQVRIDNLLNKGNQQLLEIRARIMDRHNVLLHSLYYKLQTPSMNNLINFESVILNNPSVKRLFIENVTGKDLVLEFSSSMPAELEIFEFNDEELITGHGEEEAFVDQGSFSDEDLNQSRRAYAASISREKLLESLEESQPRLSKSVASSTPFLVQQGGQPQSSIHVPSLFSQFDKKSHNRSSFDLTNNGSSEYHGLKTALSGSQLRSTDLHPDSAGHIKPLTGPGDMDLPGPAAIKRVHSSAMLLRGKELVSEGVGDDINHESFLDVVKRFCEVTAAECSFSDNDEARKFVDRKVKDRELLISLLDDAPRKLNSVGRLNLCSGEKKALYVVLLMSSQFHPSFQSRLQKFPSKINIQLLEYDKQLQHQWEPGMGAFGSQDQIPTRELPVHIQVCRAVLSLAQKNISFGKMFTNEHRAKTLVLNNNSDVSILYKIKKTGSIASGDLHILDGRLGILPPHRNKEVNFVFQPSLSGSFYETLTVSNIYDPSNDQIVKLKAVISRADTFWLSTTRIDFGTVNAGEWCTSQRFILRNTSKQTRTYMLRDANHQVEKGDGRHIAVPDRQVKIRFIAEPKQAISQTILQPDQEHIEALERKFLGFQRKGKGEKAAKIWRQIEESRVKAANRLSTDSPNGMYPSLDPAAGHVGTKHEKGSGSAADQGMDGRSPSIRHLPMEVQELTLSSDDGAEKASSPQKGRDGTINFALKGGDTQAILVSCFPYLRTPFLQPHRIQGVFLAYEGKNEDVVKHIHYEVSILPENTTNGMDFRMLSMADVENLPKLHLSLLGTSPSFAPSPNLSPESSESATPRAIDTPGQQELESPGRFSVFSSRETAHAKGVENSLALQAGMWRSPDLLARWRMHPAADPPTSVESEFDQTGVSDDSSNGPSRLGSYGSLYPFEPLLKIEPCRPAHNQNGWNPDLSLHSAPSEISSAADLARSLSLTWLESDLKLQQRSNMGSGLIFYDNSDHDGYETSFLLRSTSAQDIWVQLCLSCGNPAPEVDLWVEDVWNDSVERGVSGLMSADSVVTGNSSNLSVWPRREPSRQQLLWEQSDSGESHGTGLIASTCLKGGTVSRVQLTISDSSWQLWCHCVVSSLDKRPLSAFDSLTGLLTINTRPSDGVQHQLSLSMGKLDRAIKVLPSAVVFPESDLSSILTSDITVTNRTGENVEFMARMISTRPSTISTDQSLVPAEAVVQIEPAVGEIKAFGSLLVKITCQPTKPGKQTYTLHLRSSQCYQHTPVSITLSPQRCRSLRLPDIPDGGTLDMGYYFLNAPGGIKGVLLRLENLLSEPVALTFKSNLAKQAYISLDPSGAERTDEMDLAAHGCRDVFMCLRPGGDAAAYEIGQCREIIGGMRITVRSAPFGPNHTKDSGGSGLDVPIDEVMVKFRAMVGWSLLQLSSLVIDLGRVQEIGGSISGTFDVSNPSSKMPLEIGLSSQQAVLSLSHATLVGRDVAKSLGDYAGTKADLAVDYSLSVKEYGLIEDSIVVHNMSCEGHDADLLLRLFATNGSIEAAVNPPLPHFGFTSYVLLKGHIGEQIGVDNDDAAPLHTSEVWDSTHDPTFRGIETLPNATKLRLRKAFSTSAAEGNLGNKQEEDKERLHLRKMVLEDNMCLDLGTVFVCGDQTCQVNGPIMVGDEDALFYVSDLRPYHSSCVIWNHTDSVYVLQPFSDLPLMVNRRSERREAVEAEARDPLASLRSCKRSSQSGKWLPLRLDKFVPCGPPFLVQPGSSTFLEVSWRWMKRLTSVAPTSLMAGNLSCFDGLLAFQICSSGDKREGPGQEFGQVTCKGPEIAEVLVVKGSICLSEGKIVSEYINLGKVGYTNGWENVEFSVDVQNNSDAELIYQILDAPDCFMIHVEDPQWDLVARSRLAPRSEGKFRVTLLTGKLEHTVEAGSCSWKLRVLNCNNPLNVMEVVVEAEMTVHTLQLAGLWHSVLLLPPLTVPPSQNSAQSIAQFTVENLSHEPLAVALELHQVEESESLVTFAVFHSSLTQSVEEIRLGPGERIDLRVSARATSDIIPPKFSRQAADGKLIEGIRKDSRHYGEYEDAGISEHKQSLAELSKAARSLQGHRYRGGQINLGQVDEVGFPELVATFCLGHLLLFSSPHLPDCIPIHGTLIQGPLFDVLPQSLLFQARIDPQQEPLMSEGSSSVRRWDLWKDVSGPSDTLVVRNLRVFDSFHFSVRAEVVCDGQQQLNGELVALKRFSDQALSYLFVQPMEGSIPPQGSVEIVVKARPWSAEFYEEFIRAKPNTESIVITIYVQEVEEDGSQGCQSVLVTINPPCDVPRSPSQEAVFENQSLASTNLQVNVAASQESFGVVRPQKHEHPLLGLRGCTPVKGSPQCYDFNLGQQNVSAGGRLHWDLTLMGDQKLPLHYNLSTISESDSRWLTISTCAGQLEPCEHKIVQLSFSTRAMGVYSTYLVIENIENPADLKMVHLSLEVVSSRNARPDAQSLTFFHVLVEGDRTEGRTIHMGDVYYNFWYRNRSFVIVNEATVAMEFLLSSSMEYNTSVELNFSLDNTSLKRFSSLTVDPKSSVRVWIHFCPGVFKGSIGEDICDDMSASIFVNCRLVKDYQRCIPFHATCRYPQIGISTTDVVFSLRRPGRQPAVINVPVEDVDITQSFVATGSDGGLHGRPLAVSNHMPFADHPQFGLMWNAQTVLQADGNLTPQGVSPVTHITLEKNEGFELLPHVQVIRLSNLYSHRQLNYVVRNDSLFFETECLNPPVTSTEENGKPTVSQGYYEVIVRPIAGNIKAHQEIILKQKYVEEHVTIYNRSHPRERYTVSVRITAGYQRNFFAALGSRDSYPFRRLELGITSFLSSFYSLTSSLLVGIQESPQTVEIKESRNDPGTDPLIKHPSPVNQRLVSFLEDRLSSFGSSGDQSREYRDVFFDFQYLTDELVFYSLKERWSRGSGTLELAAVQLAKLLYCTLFRCQVVQLCVDTCQAYKGIGHSSLPSQSNLIEKVMAEEYSTWKRVKLPPNDHSLLRVRFLADWIGQLGHFLSYFPDSRDDLVPLRALHQTIEGVLSHYSFLGHGLIDFTP